MTLIALLMQDRYPVLLGDLLISGKRGPSEIHLPGPGRYRGESKILPGVYPTNLKQKLTLISPYLAVGWAGEFLSGFHVIRRLQEQFHGRQVTRAEVLSFIATLDPQHTRAVSLVGLSVHGRSVYILDHMAEEVDHPLMGKMFLAGSGSHSFREHLNYIDPTSLRVGGGPVNPFELAVSKAIYCAGTAFANEADTTASLAYMYGGGYEFITISEGDEGNLSLCKVPATNYAFWALSNDRSAISLQMLVNFRYERDLLLATRIVPSYNRNKRRIELKEVSLYPIPPAYRGLTSAEKTLPQAMPDMNAPRLLNFVFFPPEIEGRGILFLMSGGSPLPIHLRSRGRDLEVSFQTAQLDAMLQMAQAAPQRM